jgi:hypothetical protein
MSTLATLAAMGVNLITIHGQGTIITTPVPAHFCPVGTYAGTLINTNQRAGAHLCIRIMPNKSLTILPTKGDDTWTAPKGILLPGEFSVQRIE